MRRIWGIAQKLLKVKRLYDIIDDMKDDWNDMNVEELAPTPADNDEEEIVLGGAVVGADFASAEVLEEVRNEKDEEIQVGEMEERDDWHRAVKHLNRRIGELEEAVAELRAALAALSKVTDDE